MENLELYKIINSFKSPVKNINYDMINNITKIELENGNIFDLFGKHMELENLVEFPIKKCSFCNKESIEPLFTTNDKIYICKECSILSIKTYLDNGYEVNLEISDSFPDVSEQLINFEQNLNKK